MFPRGTSDDKSSVYSLSLNSNQNKAFVNEEESTTPPPRELPPTQVYTILDYLPNLDQIFVTGQSLQNTFQEKEAEETYTIFGLNGNAETLPVTTLPVTTLPTLPATLYNTKGTEQISGRPLVQPDLTQVHQQVSDPLTMVYGEGHAAYKSPGYTTGSTTPERQIISRPSTSETVQSPTISQKHGVGIGKKILNTKDPKSKVLTSNPKRLHGVGGGKRMPKEAEEDTDVQQNNKRDSDGNETDESTSTLASNTSRRSHASNTSKRSHASNASKRSHTSNASKRSRTDCYEHGRKVASPGIQMLVRDAKRRVETSKESARVRDDSDNESTRGRDHRRGDAQRRVETSKESARVRDNSDNESTRGGDRWSGEPDVTVPKESTRVLEHSDNESTRVRDHWSVGPDRTIPSRYVNYRKKCRHQKTIRHQRVARHDSDCDEMVSFYSVFPEGITKERSDFEIKMNFDTAHVKVNRHIVPFLYGRQDNESYWFLTRYLGPIVGRSYNEVVHELMKKNSSDAEVSGETVRVLLKSRLIFNSLEKDFTNDIDVKEKLTQKISSTTEEKLKKMLINVDFHLEMINRMNLGEMFTVPWRIVQDWAVFISTTVERMINEDKVDNANTVAEHLNDTIDQHFGHMKNLFDFLARISEPTLYILFGLDKSRNSPKSYTTTLSRQLMWLMKQETGGDIRKTASNDRVKNLMWCVPLAYLLKPIVNKKIHEVPEMTDDDYMKELESSF